MVKLENMVEETNQPTTNNFLTPGSKVHLIGSQDGSFVPFGHHIENEMGGLWMHPIKLLDGFWLGISQQGSNTIDWLQHAYRFVNYPFYNEHFYVKNHLNIKRKQISSDDFPGFIVQYEFNNNSDSIVEEKINLLVRTDLRPVWYSETQDIFSGIDEVIEKDKQVIVKDSKNNWFVGLDFSLEDAELSYSYDLVACDPVYGSGIGINWESSIILNPYETKTITLRIAGSINSAAEVYQTLNLLQDTREIFNIKKMKYEEIIQQSNLSCPDKELEYIYAWVKCHTEWLSLDVPNFGKGIVAGIPEYPWWFGIDSSYAIQGILPAGFHNVSKQTLSILRDLSKEKNNNGRIIHEANTFGIVGNPGNTQETAHYIVAVWETFNWTGDVSWLESHYTSVKNGLKWLLEEKDSDKDLFPEGYGIIEILGLNGEMIDTAVYTYQALIDASKMAIVFNENELSDEYQVLAKELLTKIQNDMWVEDEGLYGDLRISANELYTKIDSFIEQEQMGNDTETIEYYQDFKNKLVEHRNDTSDKTWCFKNWVINTPLEMNIAKREQAKIALDRLNSDEFIGVFGMKLSGIEGESGRRIMTISSAVQIQANLQYQETEHAFDIMKKVMKTFGKYLPGSISEMSPDYGCFVQAWTAYAFLNPVVKGFAGIYPNVVQKTIHLKPQLPQEWNEMSIENIVVGSNQINIHIYRKDEMYVMEVETDEQDWEFTSESNVLVKVI